MPSHTRRHARQQQQQQQQDLASAPKQARPILPQQPAFPQHNARSTAQPGRLLLACLVLAASAARPALAGSALAAPTACGFLPLPRAPGSSLWFGYWEAARPAAAATADTPIVLWLQGGPGCASSFGWAYEIGPRLLDDAGALRPNRHAWTQAAGLLLIDQPIGTGYSPAASEADIPRDELGIAQDLYAALWAFFEQQPQLQGRPLIVAGESYAGKYVPSLVHYVLQAEALAAATSGSSSGGSSSSDDDWDGRAEAPLRWGRPCGRAHAPGSSSNSSSAASSLAPRPGRKQLQHSGQLPLAQQGRRTRARQAARCRGMRHARRLGGPVPAPNFRLAGAAIGNGLTDPLTQTWALPGTAFSMGLVTQATAAAVSDQAEVVAQLVREAQWPQATQARSRLLKFIEAAAGVATLLDVRRTAAYDAAKTVDALLDSAEARALLGASAAPANYSSCSAAVEAAMAGDVMRSALPLVEDILDVLPLLIYTGQFDAQDGVASTNAWLAQADWEYAREFRALRGEVWSVAGVPAGWRRSQDTLTQVMVRNAGHLVPRDAPEAALAMLRQWLASVLAPGPLLLRQERQAEQQRSAQS